MTLKYASTLYAAAGSALKYVVQYRTMKYLIRGATLNYGVRHLKIRSTWFFLNGLCPVQNHEKRPLWCNIQLLCTL